MNTRLLGFLLFATLIVAEVAAQCPVITFDDLPAGTRLSTQYAGVTFSGRSGAALGPLPVIYNPVGATSSEPQCLSAWGDGTGEFSEDFLRLDFARDQTAVTFTLGVRVGCFPSDTVTVRVYDTAAVLRRTINVPVNGDAPPETVNVIVHAARTDAGPFRRIEIEAGLAGGCAARFELIDDLIFNIDDTPPIAEITSPTALSCFCPGGTIFGSAYDPDGPITGWRLERQAPGAPSWTLISTSTTEIMSGALSAWFPAASAADGYYILRLTVTNICGETAVATTVVWLDRAFNSLALRSPTAGMIVGGNVCADGTIWDHCSGSLAVEYRPLAGAFAPFTTVAAPWVITDTLGTWNTRAGIADGNYEIRITGTDACDNSDDATVAVVVDNTPPIAVITTPLPCSPVDGRVAIRGTVNDANLGSWTLQYTGGGASTWQTISSGTRPVINGLLGVLDFTDLASCCYTLRLVATDTAILDCNNALHNQREYLVSIDADDCAEDIDGDGDIDLTDLAYLLTVFGSACP
ncbi:MAG: hypothetical protein ACKVS9_00130 [Phycisphaerae bacterium]